MIFSLNCLNHKPLFHLVRMNQEDNNIQAIEDFYVG
jgi:hypothetical protein